MSLTPSSLLGRSPNIAPNETTKSVQLSEEPETIPPATYLDEKSSSTYRQHRASISGKKMTGRPNIFPTSSSSSLVRQTSGLSLNEQNQQGSSDSYFEAHSHATDPRKVLAQVAEWLQKEKTRQYKRRMQKHHAKHHAKKGSSDPVIADDDNADQLQQDGDHESGSALEKLESIMAGYMKSMAKPSSRSPLLGARDVPSRKGSIASKLKRNSVVNLSSDTEFFGDEVLVPNVEATLDNSKTLAYSGGSDDADETVNRKSQKCWVVFKEDILRLTHTLKLKGWRRIPMENAAQLDVKRLSGALTNAVYVVKPPKPTEIVVDDGKAKPPRPKFLLLRIYGPQAEHLIDRDNELSILRRLAQKKIGPRLLGTFSNGRFEEYLHAITLVSEDLRVPETSKQIAKRMREDDEGIELLTSEVEAGPAIFMTWDKYLDRCEKVITYLDQQVALSIAPPQADVPEPPKQYTRYGLICGVPWSTFRRTYDRYRKRLVEECGGNKSLRSKLIFAHNDTQYGNLMRLTPSGESPLLQPSNHHKQLVVIDFEYAGQNTAGLEFANHFTEWCYNYHHPDVPWACHAQAYPTEEEQHRFIRSYVMHRPQFTASASSTPNVLQGKDRTNIPEFMLDARAQQGSSYDVEEKERERKQEEEIQRLMHETRLWRMANTAHWVAWGIVQAQVPELDEEESDGKGKRVKAKEVLERVVEGVKSGLSGRRGSRGVVHPDGAGKVLDEPVDEDDAAQDCVDRSAVHDDEPHIAQNGTTSTDKTTSADNTTSETAAPKSSSSNAAAATTESNKATAAAAAAAASPGELEAEAEAEQEAEEFDYLAYAQDRAMFFWGDALQMGLIAEEELPEEIRGRVKRVAY